MKHTTEELLTYFHSEEFAGEFGIHACNTLPYGKAWLEDHPAVTELVKLLSDPLGGLLVELAVFEAVTHILSLPVVEGYQSEHCPFITAMLTALYSAHCDYSFDFPEPRAFPSTIRILKALDR